MKKLIFLFTFFCSSINAQDKSLEYFDAGNIAVNKEQYQLADSLFTLSIKLKATADTYYNRAAVRKKLNRMADYCSDIGLAASLNDQESTDLFWRDCCSKDTLYSDKDGANTGKGTHAYYEVVCKMKYSTDNSYRKYTSINKKIVSFDVTNNDTIYSLTPTPPIYAEKEEFIKMILMNNCELKKEDIKNITVPWVVVSYTVQKNGENGNIKCKSNIGKVYDEKVEAIFKKYIKNWKPAEYNGKKVNYAMSVAFVPKVISNK